MKPIDIVYVLGTGSNWSDNEIRFSLRSVFKNLTNIGQIFIVGEKPAGLKGFIHIDHPDEFPSTNADGKHHPESSPGMQGRQSIRKVFVY
jgi:hypothetical protein